MCFCGLFVGWFCSGVGGVCGWLRVIDVGCWVIFGGLVNSVDFCYSFSFVLYVVFLCLF